MCYQCYTCSLVIHKTRVCCCVYLVMFCIISTFSNSCSGYDALDPAGNITIKWDVVNWTSDGYIAMITISNFQQYQPIREPGWILGWSWVKEEVIWSVMGGRTIGQGGCSRFHGKIPQCCQEKPKIVDLMPGAKPDQRVPSCCKGGTLAAWLQDPVKSISAFQLVVGSGRTAKRRISIPENFTFGTAEHEFSCGSAVVGKPTKVFSQDGKLSRHDKMSWSITCAQPDFARPSCCVSFSSFQSDTLWRCPSCSCGCENDSRCINSKLSPSGVRCTNHMCPIRVHWHLKLNNREYWQVKLTIINFDEKFSFSMWNLIVQHPDFDNTTLVVGLNYKLLNSGKINEAGIIWGVNFHNDLLKGGTYIESHIQFTKHNVSLTSSWTPHSIFFDGRSCTMSPVPDFYLANASCGQQIFMLMLLALFVQVIAFT